jgi:hypothetical protein
MKIALPVLLILLNACNNAAENKQAISRDSVSAPKDSLVAAKMQKKVSPDTSGKKAASSTSKKEYLLSYKNDSLEQTMRVIEVSLNLMNFRLITTNTRGGFSDTIKGKLTYVQSSGDENDVGDDLKGFFYDDWNYTDKKTGCMIDFRIDVDEVRYIRVEDFNCSLLLDHHCPIETKGVLKRVDIP